MIQGMFYAALLAVLLGLLLWIDRTRLVGVVGRITPILLSPYRILVPFFGLVFVVLFFSPSYTMYSVLLLVLVAVSVFVWRFFSHRTPPPPRPTPPPAPPTPPVPPVRSVWGRRVLLGVMSVMALGALAYLFHFFGEEVREFVPGIPDMPDVPIPQSRGDFIQWLEGLRIDWGEWVEALPYLFVIAAWLLSYYMSLNKDYGYKSKRVAFETALFTFLAVLAYQFQDILIALFGVVGISADGVVSFLYFQFGIDPFYLVMFLTTTLLSWVALTGLTQKAMVKAMGLSVAYIFLFRMLLVEGNAHTVIGIQALAVLLILGLILPGYPRRASILALTASVLLALIHT